MTASWKQLPVHILLILASSRNISAKTVASTASPSVAPISALPSADKHVVIHSGENQVKDVEVVNPVNLSLECVWGENPNKQPSIGGFWRKDGVEVENSRVTVNLENQQYKLKQVFSIVLEENLGNYTCVFGNETELHFTLAAPTIGDSRDKPIVSYLADFVVLTCKMEEHRPKPNTWNWYKGNGTDMQHLSEKLEHHRYYISNQDFKTKLKVKNLTEDDSGMYFCGAVYPIGISTSRMELKVIELMEPLKPFLVILVEVVILVTVILVYERSRSKKKEPQANGPNPDQKNRQPQGEDTGAEESSSVRQRKT